MATYVELFDLRANDGLRNKIAVASIKKAQTLLDLALPTTNQVKWASGAIDNPMDKARQLINYVLAANSASTVSQITSASDATIQTNVNTAVDALIAGGIV
jgi:hypothetical protein